MVTAAFRDTSFTSTSSGSSRDTQGPQLNPPTVTALAWSLVDGRTGELLWGKDFTERLEIASLTKIMTAYTTIRTLRLLKLDCAKVVLQVSPRAAMTVGTLAGLREGDKLKVSQMLYGLLLPSGNDAALALAEGCGKLMIEGWGKSKVLKRKLKRFLNVRTVKELPTTDAIEIFVRCMNRFAARLGLTKSTFSNPSGLADKGNKSTAEDLGRLVWAARKESLIATIAKTREYKCLGADGKSVMKEFSWANTNQLLKDGFDGFKTGITPTAGPCLIGTRTYRKVGLVITVLHCKTCEHRWKEVSAIYAWAGLVIDYIYATNADEGPNLKKLPLLFHKVV